MCPSGATCLPADCCFSELVLQKSSSACWSRTKRTSSSFLSKLTCSRHGIAENCRVGIKQHPLTHSCTLQLVEGVQYLVEVEVHDTNYRTKYNICKRDRYR